MKKLFVVTSNPTTTEQDTAFFAWFEDKFNWWHWLNQTWLLIDETGTRSVTEIRVEFLKCAPKTHVMVFEITSDAHLWSGYGPNSKTDDENNMFKWLKENWQLG